MSSQSPALTAAQKYWDALAKQDIEAVKAALTADASRKIYPEHLKAPNSDGRDAIIAVMVPAWTIVRTSNFEVVNSCVEGNKVWAQVKVAATLSNGEAFNPELIYMLETRKDDDGVHKVSKTSEFVDAVEGQKVLTLFQQLGKQ